MKCSSSLIARGVDINVVCNQRSDRIHIVIDNGLMQCCAPVTISCIDITAGFQITKKAFTVSYD